MPALFLITSAIRTRHGIFSTEERLNQTITTLDSIKKYAPESKIILLESSAESSITDEEAAILNPYLIALLNFNHDQQVKDIYNAAGDNWDVAKNITELTVFGKALNFILKEQPQLMDGIDRVFKLSGRYTLNENFNMEVHNESKNQYVFSSRRPSTFPIFVTNGLTQQVMSRLWSWPANKTSLVFFRYNLMVEDFIGCNHQGKYRDTEHLLLKYFDGPHIKEIPIIGVEGQIGPNGALVKD